MKIRGLLLILLVVAACSSPDTLRPWSVRETAQKTQVVFQSNGTPIILNDRRNYSDYRPLSRNRFAKFHVPSDATSAFVGRQGRHNYNVFYVVDSRGVRSIYNFTFGKFDIDWPPTLLYQIDSDGRVRSMKSR